MPNPALYQSQNPLSSLNTEINFLIKNVESSIGAGPNPPFKPFGLNAESGLVSISESPIKPKHWNQLPNQKCRIQHWCWAESLPIRSSSSPLLLVSPSVPRESPKRERTLSKTPPVLVQKSKRGGGPNTNILPALNQLLTPANPKPSPSKPNQLRLTKGHSTN